MYRRYSPPPGAAAQDPITTPGRTAAGPEIVTLDMSQNKVHLDVGRDRKARPRRRRFRPRIEGPEAMPALVDRLRGLCEDRETVSFGLLAQTIGSQGHAPLLLVAAIFMVLPIGMIPGVGGALGVLVAAVGLQMFLNRKGVFLPRFFAKRELPADKICALADKIQPVFEWLRDRMAIRWEILSRGRASIMVIAVILMICGGSLVVIGAIPIATPLMGVPVTLFAIGLLARDGVVVALAYLSVIAVTVAFVYIRQQTG